MCPCLSPWASASGEIKGRLALVVGNAAYRNGRLPTAADDAGLVARSLSQAGFDVTAVADTDALTLRTLIQAFVDKIRASDGHATVFVYLSGYGLQYAGDNYILPVDARIDHQTDVPNQAVALSDIEHAIEGPPARARIFAFDLARDAAQARADPLPLATGLMPERAPPGSLYAFNAAPGTTAPSDIPPYGVYARALAELILTPGLGARDAFERLRLRIAERTGTVPWDDVNLAADETITPSDGPVHTAHPDRPRGDPSAGAAFWTAIVDDRLSAYQDFVRTFPDHPMAARVRTMAAVRLEASTWAESVRVDAAAAYWTYMRRYPHGPHYIDVRRRLARLHMPLEPPSRYDPYDFVDCPPPTPDQTRFAPGSDLTPGGAVWPPSPPMPDDLLPQPLPVALDLELAPPPLTPHGVLPIPGVIRVKGSPSESGHIFQPLVPGLGAVAIDTDPGDGADVMTSAQVGLITRTTTTSEAGLQTILQVDAADEFVSRTVVARSDASRVTVSQTGTDGAIMSALTQVDPLGERVTTLSNGGGQLVARVRSDRRGVIREVTHGTARQDDGTFPFPILPETSLRPEGAQRNGSTAPVPVPLSHGAPAISATVPNPPPSDKVAAPQPRLADPGKLSSAPTVGPIPMPVPRPVR
jgi:uncharacterized caspase-like protein